ncbi:uncharacterized protein CG3556-like [Stomoxys calcitrans]|uniref:uncharacterized protein CG3556-like n=1 Tax=Stomoxys calcitrans TaxID=35570 RepID=UPI0027E2E281|nr:uncharacterized protein CG3556-like [Stomoxys calcitrans]
MSQSRVLSCGRLLLLGLLITHLINNAHPTNEAKNSESVAYAYTIWIGSNVTEELTILLNSPVNTNFYDAMIQAAELDSRFAFEAKDTPLGHYITSISGIKEDVKKNVYWLIYCLPDHPDPNQKPGEELMSPVGVDFLIVKNGAHYLFWYRDVDLSKGAH